MSPFTPDACMLFLSVILFSAVIGAYCTTIDHRIRKDLPLITKDCFCPFCGCRIAVTDQIPVISWLLLRGRCRSCKTRIPLRYPLIEGSFILFYSAAFLAFHSRPLFCVGLWYLFVTAFLFFRSDKHFRSLRKGLALMYVYHLIYAAVLLAILAALDTASR